MTEPISKAAGQHEFRIRDIKKEIQPQMTFSKNKIHSFSNPRLSTSSWSSTTSNKDTNSSSSNPMSKIYSKAVIDLYMQNGSLKRPLANRDSDLDYENIPVKIVIDKAKIRGQSLTSSCDVRTVDSTSMDEENYTKANSSKYENAYWNPLLKSKKSQLSTRDEEKMRKTTHDMRTVELLPLRNLNGRPLYLQRKTRIQKMAKKYLLNSNIQAQKSSNILRKGEGMLMSSGNFLKTNRQVYNELRLSII